MTSSPALRWQLFRLLGEPARLRLLACAEREELSLGELADALGESLPNVSRHTTQLRQAGLLDERRLGTRTFVRFANAQSQDPLIDDALRVGRALCDEDAVFARIPEIIRRRDARTRELLQREGEPRPARGVSDELPLTSWRCATSFPRATLPSTLRPERVSSSTRFRQYFGASSRSS